MSKDRNRIVIMMEHLETPQLIKGSLIKILMDRMSVLDAAKESCVTYAMMDGWVDRLRKELDYYDNLRLVIR